MSTSSKHSKQDQDMARDERYRRRQERKEDEAAAAEMWEYVSACLGIESPSQADSALFRLRDFNKRVADMLNACNECNE